jgi:hypothetical protein
MASVSGSFFGLTLGHFLQEIAQIIQLGADSFGSWQNGLRVAFLGDELTAHLGRCQARIEAVGAEVGVGLALAIADGLDIRPEVGEMRFRPLPPTQGKGIDTDYAAVEFVQAFAKRHPPPPQCARGALLPTRPQFFDGAGHQQAPRAALACE